MNVDFCPCCSIASNSSNSNSPSISECSIPNIHDFSLFSGSTSDQIQYTVGNFQYQHAIGHSQQLYMQHSGHYHPFHQNPNVLPTESDHYLANTTLESGFLAQPVYHEGYHPYDMVYSSSERFLGTSQYIPIDINHGYYEYLNREVYPATYNQITYHPVDHGYPLLIDNIKLENTEVNCTKRKIISCNRPARTRNVRKTKVMQLQCSVCFKTFTRPYNLKSHIKIHTKERPYLCEYEECKWTFARPHDLKRHQLLHSGVKPYKCICDKRFSRSDAYKRHLKTNPECALMVAFMSNSSH